MSRLRRVLIIVENLPCPFDRRVWQEATTLQSAGYEVSIVCPKGSGFNKSHEVLEGVHIYRHSLPLEGDGPLGYLVEYGAALFWEFFLAVKVAITRGFDVIHACNPPDTIFLVALPFKLLGKKFIFDHHDINPELYEAKFGRRGLMYRLICLMERWTYRAADWSIATNDSYRAIAIERGGMAAERVSVVRSGPSLERIHLVPPNEKWRFGKRYLVGYVGVMGKQEGLELLLEAVGHMVHERKRVDVHFLLVGDGTELEHLRSRCTTMNLDAFVTFTGRIPDGELLEVLSTSDVCVNPDLANEMNDKSTMNKIMEYMALSKPIVQFDLTEGRVSAGEASLYAQVNNSVDLAEKTLELLDDPDRRARMGEIGRSRVESELSWQHQAPKLLSLYEMAFETING